jgi:hypothetical protein
LGRGLKPTFNIGEGSRTVVITNLVDYIIDLSSESSEVRIREEVSYIKVDALKKGSDFVYANLGLLNLKAIRNEKRNGVPEPPK